MSYENQLIRESTGEGLPSFSEVHEDYFSDETLEDVGENVDNETGETRRTADNKARNLAELQRQLDRTTSELATLEGLSQWGNDTYRFGIQHAKQQIEKLTAAIEKANQ